MKKGVPKINLGFYKDGFKINSKQFHPLNMSIKGLKLECDKEYKPVDPLDLLESLNSVDVRDATKVDKIASLKAMLEKANI